MRNLSELKPEERGTIQQVNGAGALRKRLLDMGVVPGAEIEVVRVAPLGDPVEYRVRGYRLSLRRQEAAHVLVEQPPGDGCPGPGRGRRGKGRRRGRRRRRWLARLTSTGGRKFADSFTSLLKREKLSSYLGRPALEERRDE